MPADYTISDVTDWLGDIAVGRLDLRADNIGLATTALTMIEPAPEPGDLSPHFSLAELTYSDTANAMGLDNRPDEEIYGELSLLANDTLEKIRTLLGDLPVVISSGYRCPELNAAVGGAANSAHLYGAAADFTVPAYGTPLEVCRALQDHLAELEIDQLIHENDAWVHVGRAPGGGQPRCQCLTIDNGQTVTGIV
jgi:hypothetical protein